MAVNGGLMVQRSKLAPDGLTMEGLLMEKEKLMQLAAQIASGLASLYKPGTLAPGAIEQIAKDAIAIAKQIEKQAG
jgi:hypothetical protein